MINALQEDDTRVRAVQAAFEGAADGLIAVDEHGVIEACNHRAATVFGYAPDELLATAVTSLLPGVADATRMSPADSNDCGGGIPSSNTPPELPGDELDRRAIRAQGRDGSPITLEVIVTRIPGHAGVTLTLRPEETGMQRVRRDVQTDPLLRHVSGTAHDLNNLVAGILGSLDRVLDDLETGHPAQHELEQVREATTEGATMLRGLLSLTTPSAAPPRALDVAAAVRESLPTLELVVGEAVHVRHVSANTPLPVHISRGELEQILLNLAANARDAMPQGGTLHVETRLAEEPPRVGNVPARKWVQLEMRDEGAGMDPETLGQVLEPYFTTKGHSGGMGIGLSMVQTIVEDRGGRLQLDSMPGSGTWARIVVPFACD